MGLRNVSTARRLGLLLALASGTLLSACDQFYTFFGTVPPDYRPPFPTGTIIGKVIDRGGKPVDGASVSDGANVSYTGLGETVTLETGSTGNLGPGEYVLTRVPSGRVVNLKASFDGIDSPTVQTLIQAFDPTKPVSTTPTSRNAPTRLAVALVLPIDAPEDATDTLDSDGVFDSVNMKVLTSIEVATASAGLTYSPSSDVRLALHRPPGASSSLTVRRVQLQYLNENDLALPTSDTGLDSNVVTRSLSSPVTFLPGTAIKSGPTAVLTVPVALSTSAFRDYLTNPSGSGRARVEIRLRVGDSSSNVRDRANGGEYRAIVDLRFKR
ncbi:MAG: hypothetical protein VKP72_12765 [bacterium]|nr:hypothetical protein [bacterium]